MKSSPLFSTLAALPLGTAFIPLTRAEEVPAVKVDPKPLPQVAGTITTFAPVVDKVAPNVVTIATSKMVRRGAQQNQNPLFNDPMFRRFFGIPDDQEAPKEDGSKNGRKRKQRAGLGSGVVVSPEGHILTNNHVIEGADEIIVTLGNGKQEYVAKKIGTDPSTDLAVLKIEPAEKLQGITFADSDKIRVGDLAIAVGSPFGLTQSVTMGIVSATGRGGPEMRIAEFENFIQTDASINPGNSGGALVDMEGRLMGINTAIFSRTGGNQGIGFAVPANLARTVMEGLIKHGKVSRGFLGIALQPLSDELAKAFKIPGNAGALVAEVTAKSPAEKAGVQAGDVVVAVNGQKVDGPRELQLQVAGIPPRTKVEVKLVRDGQEKVVNVELGERPSPRVASSAPTEKPDEPDVLDGVTVADIDAESRKKFDLPDSAKGVVITEIDQDSASFEAGLKVGDVIHEINREAVTSGKQAEELSEKMKKEKRVLLRVSTKGNSRYVVVEHKD